MNASVAKCLSHLITYLGSNEFESQFFNACRDIFNGGQCTVCISDSKGSLGRLMLLVTEHEIVDITDERVEEYAEFGIGYDQAIEWAKNYPISSDGEVGMSKRSVSSCGISNDHYSHRLCNQKGDRQKITLVSELYGEIYSLNFHRNSGCPGFTQKDSDLLGEVGATLVRLFAKHRALKISDNPIPSSSGEMSKEFREILHKRITEALLSEGVGLTPKEAEICAYIAIGFSANGIGLLLGISINTVATHRKRAYSKLGITSQSEIFARYYSSVIAKINCVYTRS